jgi:DNA-binding NarL/FixJ family response regulator
VLVADHHGIVRAGITAILSAARAGQRYELTEAATSEEALEKIRSGRYDVVLVRYELAGRGGIKTTELILQRAPDLPVLGLMETADREATERMVAAGARGCILTSIEPDTLEAAIRTVIAGRSFYSNEIALLLLEPGVGPLESRMPRLTEREKEVFRGILKGLRNREIATQLGIGKRTVDKHRQRLNAKLGVRTAVALVEAGMRLGLLGSDHHRGQPDPK